MNQIKELYNPEKSIVIESEENKNKIRKQRDNFLSRMDKLYPKYRVIQSGGSKKK